MVINEMAARELGFANASEAANQQLFIDWRGETIRFEVVGVVKDFHFQDLHSEIKPYGFQMVGQNSYNYLIAHASGARLQDVLSDIETAWAKLNPGEPFEYNFLDESFDANYAADERLSQMVYYFTIIAIFISCMGLFGLATFSAEQRTREIGIRKVLGASVSGIVSLLSKDFLRLVIIAVVIGSPVAAWVMHRWLNDFAYRTNIEWTVFLVTALIAVIIALLTISVQAIRAALANPVKSLRES
jgi:putative ABC transport system permease protein